jgi:hypothetical protein
MSADASTCSRKVRLPCNLASAYIYCHLARGCARQAFASIPVAQPRQHSLTYMYYSPIYTCRTTQVSILTGLSDTVSRRLCLVLTD